jgi:hypothetical protein
MQYFYWKHHDDDRWYWFLSTVAGVVLARGSSYATQTEALAAMDAYDPIPDKFYRAKPGN